MTMTEAPPAADGPTPESPTPNRWRLVAAIAAAVAIIAITVAVFAVARDDGDGSSSMMARRDLTTTRQAQQACQQWSDSSAGAARSSAAPGWCSYMSDWMYDQMGSGRMTGSMMWGSPQAMQTTCERAMSGFQSQVNDPKQFCQSMVDWMSQHAANRMGWMMGGSMMGGSR